MLIKTRYSTRLLTNDSIKSTEESRDGCDRSMSAVSLTLRVNPNSNKFATVTYYKPVDPLKEQVAESMPAA